MRFLVKNLVFVFAFCSIISGQNSTEPQNLSEWKEIVELKELNRKNEDVSRLINQLEERQDKLITDLDEIPDKDIAEAKKLNAKIDRLFPCCPLVGVDRETFGMSSGYAFRTENTGDGYFATRLLYKNNQFEITTGDASHGFIKNIGKIPLEKVSEQTPEFISLAKYEAPTEIGSIKDEFVSDELKFQRKVPVKIGDTYILRILNYVFDTKLDGIYAVKVQREDSDGSIIIFVKKIKEYGTPKLAVKEKYSPHEIYLTGLIIKIQKILRERGFNEVQLVATEREIIVRGFVPVGKTDEVLKIIKEIDSYQDFKNQLTEK